MTISAQMSTNTGMALKSSARVSAGVSEGVSEVKLGEEKKRQSEKPHPDAVG